MNPSSRFELQRCRPAGAFPGAQPSRSISVIGWRRTTCAKASSAALAARGLLRRAGTQVDATLIAAPPSTKNAQRGVIRALAEGALKAVEKTKASVRALVEHPFHIVKNLFRHRKVRHRGPAKNGHQLYTLFGLANVVIGGRRPEKNGEPRLQWREKRFNPASAAQRPRQTRTDGSKSPLRENHFPLPPMPMEKSQRVFSAAKRKIRGYRSTHSIHALSHDSYKVTHSCVIPHPILNGRAWPLAIQQLPAHDTPVKQACAIRERIRRAVQEACPGQCLLRIPYAMKSDRPNLNILDRIKLGCPRCRVQATDECHPANS